MIFVDDQFVKIGGVLLPGIFKSLEITSSAMVEELEVEGKGKKPKQATGYEDSKINIEIILADDNKKTALEKLEMIQRIFRTKGQAKPKVYEIVNQHAIKRGISKVIFKELSTRETNKADEIAVSLVVWEYETVNVSATKTNSDTAKSTASNALNSTSSGLQSSSQNISSEYQNYLQNNRGTAPRISDKTSLTPAKDISS